MHPLPSFRLRPESILFRMGPGLRPVLSGIKFLVILADAGTHTAKPLLAVTTPMKAPASLLSRSNTCGSPRPRGRRKVESRSS
jgi:hypothetical protein